MKKLLFLFMMVLPIVGCTSDDENIFQSQENEPLITVKISEAKITRGCDVNGNLWTVMPEYPTQDEKEGVMKYIASQPEDVEWPDFTKYFVQHIGGSHKMYSYADGNGALHNNIDGTSSQEYLAILELDGTWTHVKNFNAGKCDNAATHNSALMTNGFLGAKTLNEYSSSDIKAYKIYKYNGNYYLAFDFSAKKGDGTIYGDEVYDDWVLKIIGLDETNDGNDGNDSDSTYYHRTDTIANVPIDTEFRWDDTIHTYIRVAIPIYKNKIYTVTVPNIECLQDDTRIVTANDSTVLLISETDKEYVYKGVKVTKINNQIILDTYGLEEAEGVYELKIPLTVKNPEATEKFKKYIEELIGNWGEMIKDED